MFSSYNPPTISSIYIEGLEISAKDAEAAAIAARDAAKAARDDALQYRNETHTYYTQVQQIQTGDYVTTQSLNDALSAFSFSDLATVPEEFTPAFHRHTWGDITGKPAKYEPVAHVHSWGDIADKPSEYEPAEHVHTWQQVAFKPSTFPPEAHYHSWSDIEGKPKVFNPAAHTHSWGDVAGKPSKFEPVAHSHDWSEVENKPLAFPPESHSHHWDTVIDKPAQATRWPTYDEVTNKPAQATRWPTYDEVTNKPTFGEGAFGIDVTKKGFGHRAQALPENDLNSLSKNESVIATIPSVTTANRPGSAASRSPILRLATVAESGADIVIECPNVEVESTVPEIHIRSFRDGVEGEFTQLATSGNNAFIVTGENANGRFIKYPDGTMICTRTATASLATSIFQTWEFPAQFFGEMTVSGAFYLGGQGSAQLNAMSGAVFGNTSVQWRMALRGTELDESTATVLLTAFGKWK